MRQLNVSARVSWHPFDRLRASLKLARTIAELVDALQYPPKLMMGSNSD
jgi:hypothetical protein